MTRPNIEEIDRLWEEATAGEWTAVVESDQPVCYYRSLVCLSANDGEYVSVVGDGRNVEPSHHAPNARAIAALHNAYPELSAYVKALEKEREWQPIDTAPKDGTLVLVVDSDGPKWSVPGQWFRDRWINTARGIITHPTHWKPLPEPPKETP